MSAPKLPSLDVQDRSCEDYHRFQVGDGSISKEDGTVSSYCSFKVNNLF